MMERLINGAQENRTTIKDSAVSFPLNRTMTVSQEGFRLVLVEEIVFGVRG